MNCRLSSIDVGYGLLLTQRLVLQRTGAAGAFLLTQPAVFVGVAIAAPVPGRNRIAAADYDATIHAFVVIDIANGARVGFQLLGLDQLAFFVRLGLGWPTCMPSANEAALIASVRARSTTLLGLTIKYTTAETVLGRYAELMAAKALKEAASDLGVNRRQHRSATRSGSGDVGRSQKAEAMG